MAKHISYLLCVIFFTFTLKSVNSINCYQCDSTDSNNPFECNEYLSSDIDLVPTDCSNIHDAQYCIKHTGRFEGEGIECYQCNATNMECGDVLINLDGGVLKPTSCDHVYDAQYCVKESGGIGTKRFCSHLDLGNYCNYVRQPGDKLEYRTCLFTCSTDGCNSTAATKISVWLLLVVIMTYALHFL